MFGGVNPSQMKGMMKKMGISQVELPVRRVVFEMADKDLVVENPNVMQIKMQGQESFQVTGEALREVAGGRSQVAEELFSDEDVGMVVGQTGKSEDEVRVALGESDGDIAGAIVSLK